MSPEELEAAREGANVDYAPDISYDDWQAMAKALLAHIDSQAAQIAALTEMLVEERARYLALENNLMWGPLPDQNTPDKLYPAHIIRGRIHWRDMARQQLKADPDLQGVTWDE